MGQLMEAMDRKQTEIHEWREANFPDANAGQQLLGVVEELGELSHHHLKQLQGIRGSDPYHEGEAQDAVGDLMIFLFGYCSYRGWNLSDCLHEAWAEVQKRDWIKNPQTGIVNEREMRSEVE
jgi:NTP pyrophosphatase (non-canonical NTP hydrolase)